MTSESSEYDESLNGNGGADGNMSMDSLNVVNDLSLQVMSTYCSHN